MQKPDPAALHDLTLFKELREDQTREILAAAHVHRYEAGEDVFLEGHDADRFFLLLDGHIRVVRTNEHGEEVIVLHIHPGGLFGIAIALGRKVYPATARAASPLAVLSWPNSVWRSFTSNYPGFADHSYGAVGARVAEMNARIMEMATKQVEERVACALVRMVQQSGEKTDAGVRIAFPVTRQNIADMTGSTLHTVSRLLSAWDKSGVIRSARREIVVTDPNALIKLAGQFPET